MSEMARQIVEAVPTRALCERIGVKLDGHGAGLCPFHGGRNTKSLKVYADRARGWHCFGCGASGDVISFARRYYGLDFRQTLVRLNDMFSLGLMDATPKTMHQIRAEEQARRRRDEEREKRINAARELCGAWESKFERYVLLAQLAEKYAPTGADAPIHPAYAYAMRELPQAKWEAESAQDAWQMAEGRAKEWIP